MNKFWFFEPVSILPCPKPATTCNGMLCLMESPWLQEINWPATFQEGLRTMFPMLLSKCHVSLICTRLVLHQLVPTVVHWYPLASLHLAMVGRERERDRQKSRPTTSSEGACCLTLVTHLLVQFICCPSHKPKSKVPSLK